MSHKSTGPLTPEHIKELANGPFGAGLEAIRRHDPFYGRQEGEKFKWEVRVSCRVYGTAIVMAASEEDAIAASYNADIEYDDRDEHQVDSVRPVPD